MSCPHRALTAASNAMNAGFWAWLAYSIFGEKVAYPDGFGGVVVARRWRGCDYLVMRGMG